MSIGYSKMIKLNFESEINGRVKKKGCEANDDENPFLMIAGTHPEQLRCHNC